MAQNVILETFSFNSFVVNENMNDTNQDPDLNFFHFHESVFLTQITYRQKILRVSLKIIPKIFSVLHLNIRGLRKNSESFKEIYNFRSSRPEVFLRKCVLEICSKFIGERPRRSGISIKLQSNFIEIVLRHGCSPVNLLHIFRTNFSKNTSGWLLLQFTILQVWHSIFFRNIVKR